MALANTLIQGLGGQTDENGNPVTPPAAAPQDSNSLQALLQGLGSKIQGLQAPQMQTPTAGDVQTVNPMPQNAIPAAQETNAAPQTAPTPQNGLLAKLEANRENQINNPDSTLSTVKGALGPFGQTSLVNGVFKLLGLGGTQPNAQNGGGDPFANGNQAQTSYDSKIMQDQSQMAMDKSQAPYNSFAATRYANDQTQLAQDMSNRNLELSTQQNIGIGTPEQSSAFREAGQASQAISKSLSNLDEAIKTQNPQQMEGTLDEAFLQGHLADQIRRLGGAGSGVMQAATEGTLLKYLSDPQNVAVASTVKGMLKAAYENAGVESTNTERIGNQILNIPKDQQGNYDTTSRDYKIAKKFAPTFGEPNGGLPDQQSFFSDIDNIGNPAGGIVPLQQQGLNQAADIGTATGGAAMAGTTGALAGAAKQFGPQTIKALNGIDPGLGDRVANALSGKVQPTAPTFVPDAGKYARAKVLANELGNNHPGATAYVKQYEDYEAKNGNKQ